MMLGGAFPEMAVEKERDLGYVGQEVAFYPAIARWGG